MISENPTAECFRYDDGTRKVLLCPHQHGRFIINLKRWIYGPEAHCPSRQRNRLPSAVQPLDLILCPVLDLPTEEEHERHLFPLSPFLFQIGPCLNADDVLAGGHDFPDEP